MALVCLSTAQSVRDSLVTKLLGDWMASSPLAKGRWAEATHIGYPALIRTKEVVAAKQYTSFFFAAQELIGLLMDANVTKTGFRHLSEFMTRRGLNIRLKYEIFHGGG